MPALLDPWRTRALACLPGAHTECPGDRSTCTPSPEQPGVPPPGVALGSKSAGVVAVDPGGCAPSGGEPIGELLPAEPSTFCCQA
ncbi:hypothetical protein WMF31_11650 [Sorangium sp. So ce1036]|uniref:hypothetical protein n=1 Tax=Sorangium sp. So ce1036 TaxID=3133328 RepID=UPI003F00675D